MQVTVFEMPDYGVCASLTPDNPPPLSLADGWYYMLGWAAPVGPFAEQSDAATAALAQVQLMREREDQYKRPGGVRYARLPLPAALG